MPYRFGSVRTTAGGAYIFDSVREFRQPADDRAALILRIRYQIGDRNSILFTDAEILMFIQDIEAANPDIDEPTLIWCTSLQLAQAMLQEAQTTGSRRREREGSVEIEDYRNELISSMNGIIRRLITSPPPGVKSGVTFVFGNTSMDETRRVENNPDSLTSGIKLGWFEDDNYVGGYGREPRFIDTQFREIFDT